MTGQRADEVDLVVRPVAPGGWRRAVVGVAVGALVGLLVSAGTQPDVPRRRP